MRRDTAPSRQAGQDVAGTISSRTTGGGGLGTDFQLGGGLQAVAYDGVDLRNGAITGQVTHTLQAGQHAPDPGGTPHVLEPIAYPIQNATRGKDQNGLGIGDANAPMYTLDNGSQHGVALVPIAFSSKDYGGDACYDLSPTLRAGNHASSHANAGSPPAIAFDARQDCVSGTSVLGAMRTSSPQAQTVCITGDITHTLKAEGFDASEDGTGRGQPIVTAFAENSRAEIRLEGGDGSRTGALTTGGGKPGQGTPMVIQGMAVRRLTPRECERLQSFPDFYTLIPMGIVSSTRAETMQVKGDPVACIDGTWWKLSADGPRYKALGNSMCVFNIRWIAERIGAELAASSEKLQPAPVVFNHSTGGGRRA